MFKILRSWSQDRLLRSVIRSSAYLFSGNTIMVGLSVLQGILVVRLVGIEGLGIVTTITMFVSNIHRLVSFRMSEVVVQSLGEALEKDDSAKAAGYIWWAVRVEAITSLAAFAGLTLLAPWAAETFVKDSTTVYLIWFYGVVLLGNGLFETSRGVLQALRHFDILAKINVFQSVLTAGIIAAAFLAKQDVGMVLTGYLAGKVFAGLAVVGTAMGALNRALGKGWLASRNLDQSDSRKLLRFAINTNLQGTVNLLTRDNIPLILAALRSQVEVGYFKLALGIINLVMLPIEPFIWPTYTEITRTITNHEWRLTRQLIRRVSGISGIWTILAGGGVAVVGPWLIPLVYGSEASPAYPSFLLLLLGYGFANILNWNRPLLLALGKPGFPVIVAFLVGIVEIALTIWLVPHGGYLVQSLILSGYFIVSISIVVWRGLWELKRQAIAAPQPVEIGHAG